MTETPKTAERVVNDALGRHNAKIAPGYTANPFNQATDVVTSLRAAGLLRTPGEPSDELRKEFEYRIRSAVAYGSGKGYRERPVQERAGWIQHQVSAALAAADASPQSGAPSDEDRIEQATWVLIDCDTDVVDRGVRDEHYRERRADVERIAPILASVSPQPGAVINAAVARSIRVWTREVRSELEATREAHLNLGNQYLQGLDSALRQAEEYAARVENDLYGDAPAPQPVTHEERDAGLSDAHSESYRVGWRHGRASASVIDEAARCANTFAPVNNGGKWGACDRLAGHYPPCEEFSVNEAALEKLLDKHFPKFQRCGGCDATWHSMESFRTHQARVVAAWLKGGAR